LLPNGKDSQLSLSLTAHSTIDAKREWHLCKLFCHILSFVLLLYILAQASVLLSHQIIQPNKKLSRSRPMLKQCHRGSLHNTTLVLGPALSHWDVGYAEWQQTRRGASSGHKSVFTLDLRKCSLVNWGAICAKVCPSQFWLVSS
jgi:hypothetical protein